MKPEFFCCIGAELKDEIAGSLKSSRIFMYRAAESQTIADMLADGFFNDADDLRVNDLILLYCPEQTLSNAFAKVSSISGGVVKTTRLAVDFSSIESLFVKTDGTSVMTGPLKMAAGSMRGAFSPYFNGVAFWKMDSENNITQIATLSDTQFLPATNDAISFGNSTKKWKDLYLSGNAYFDKDKVIRFNGTESNRYFDIYNTSDTLWIGSKYGSYEASLSFRAYTGAVTLYPNNDNQAIFGLPTRKWNRVYTTHLCSDSNGANLIDVPNKAGTMALESDIGRTNCITEIPQDIKLEFDASTKVLTLKAGSKLYVPNGSGAFTSVTIDSDKTLTNSFSGQYNNIFVFWDTTANDFRQTPTVYSGTSDQTTAANRIWYDTTNNKIKYYQNSGTTVTSDTVSFPICIMANAGSGNGFTKVMQEFQGIGYLGSSTFVLPGVKALIPNGRNADGTLKNILLTFSNPTVSTTEWANTSRLGFLTSSGLVSYGVYNYYEQDTKPVFSGTYATWFDTKNNIIIGTDDGGTTWTQYSRIYVGSLYKAANANITEFTINEPFRAVNASDKTYPRVVHIKGTMVDSATAGSAISAAGAADVVMYANGQAVINFTLRFSSAGSSGDYTYGISADLISALDGKIPKIIPVSGTCVYFNDTGVVAGDTGRAGILDPVSGKYWRFGRVYQDDGASGGWDASHFVAGWHVTGTLIGVFDK